MLSVPLQIGKKIFFEAFQTSSIKLQRIKVGPFENINQMVYIIAWNNIPINGPIILQKARVFAEVFDCKDYQALDGWLQGWKER